MVCIVYGTGVEICVHVLVYTYTSTVLVVYPEGGCSKGLELPILPSLVLPSLVPGKAVILPAAVLM